jgi:hypothetical protein
MVAWDSRKIADKFLKRANAIHPEDSLGEASYESDLAKQDFYYECYMMSFTHDKLKELLDGAVQGTFKIPEKINADSYRDAYIGEAIVLLDKLNKNEL